MLVALAIVAFGMAAVLARSSSAADSASYQRDKTSPNGWRSIVIEEVRLALQRPTKGKSDGDAELAGRKWKWSQEVLKPK